MSGYFCITNLKSYKMINELKERAYKIACEHGWYDVEHSVIHELMLIITELSEAVNADRQGRYADKYAYLSAVQATPDEDCGRAFETYIKDTVEDELADAVIRILSLAGRVGAELQEELFTEEEIRKAAATKNREFLLTEEIFAIVHDMLVKDSDGSLYLLNSMLHIFFVAYARNIDLYWYIEQKMKYNESRPYKHGNKKY